MSPGAGGEGGNPPLNALCVKPASQQVSREAALTVFLGDLLPSPVLASENVLGSCCQRGQASGKISSCSKEQPTYRRKLGLLSELGYVCTAKAGPGVAYPSLLDSS